MSSLDRVIAGFFQFRNRTLEERPSLFEELALAQTPKVMMIACCDSRVAPSILTSAAAGEIFVLRNIANLVPPCESSPTRHGTSAALQYAVCVLEVEHVVVLGHSQCGGIRALIAADPRPDDNMDFINHWMRIGREARSRTLLRLPHGNLDEQARLCEQESVKQSLANLMTFPWIHERLVAGSLELHGWYFDIGAARLQRYDPADDRFVPIEGPT